MDGTPDTRLLVGLLGDAPITAPGDVAGRLGVTPEVAAETLATLAREGLVEPADGGAYRQPPLDPQELRELYPAVAVLETLALRSSPRFEPAAIAELRAANARFRAAAHDPPAAVAADDDFHRRLVADCGNPRLLEVVERIKRELLRYERAYMVGEPRIGRSADQHDAIIAALEAGDHEVACTLLRENFTATLPVMTDQLEHG